MDMQIRDHPVVAGCMRTGYPPWTEHREYTCPVCGSECCDTVYLDRTGQAVGCDVCLTAKDVYDYYEEMEK